MLVLGESDVAAVLDLVALLDVVESGLVADVEGRVERPERPHFPVGAGVPNGDGDGTALVMPAYVHGADQYVTKLAAVHPDNPAAGLPTVSAQVAVLDAATGQLDALLGGRRLTNARTGCIGGLVARRFASPPVTVGLLGAGTQARVQARAIAAATAVDAVRVSSPSESREACAADLRTDGIEATAVASSGAAVRDADVVVTATTASDPVFPADALATDAVVVAVGAYTPETQELEPAVLERASALYADAPAGVAETGDAVAAGLGPEAFTHLGAAFRASGGDPGAAGPGRPDRGPVVVESVGTAVLDAVTATHVYERAAAADRGVEVALR